MAAINPYLTYNGNCEEAFQFYKTIFGGEFQFIGRFSEMPPTDGKTCPPEDNDKIMHVSLPIGEGTILMGSDCPSSYGAVIAGTNFAVSVNANSREEADRIFKGLSEGGNITMPMENTFWGAYFGMWVDKFGINWMMNFDENPQK
jgi:PhnB protein